MLTTPTRIDLEYLCLNMRACDLVEIMNLVPFDAPIVLAHVCDELIRNNGRGRISWANGKPCAVAALTETRPGVWEVTMFGTDDLRSGIVPLMRWFRAEAADLIKQCKGHRLQCDSRADHHEAHKLIRAMGGVAEGPPMAGYGKDGGDYQRFVWLVGRNDAIVRPHYVQAKEA
ncbi:MAG: hypothetical protein IPM06_20940 [Rhizobiales bacterium]|nr:hypothetical protein [Hyphomicrobiales bacterium]